MITEIFVEGRRLDVTADISSLLTFAIDDIKDFSSRQTTFSKTVVLPGTANNNAIFGSIFETGISNNYDPTQINIGFNFNPSVSAKCIIFQDFLQTFKGTLRIIEIDVDLHRIEYQVALNGNLTGLNVALSTSLLEELDFSPYDQNYTLANVTSSWSNTPGAGVYYPLIDYGTYSTDKHNWDIRTFRPALYVKEYIDKIFASTGNPSTAIIAGTLAGNAASAAILAAGGTAAAAKAAYDAAYAAAFAAAAPAAAAGAFRYQCDLFNTDRFKRLVIPYNKKIFQHLSTSLFSASRSNGANVLDQASTYFIPLPMNTVIGTTFSPSIGNSRFTYIGATSQAAHFTFSCGNRIQRQTHNFHIAVYVNSVLVAGSQQDYPPNGIASPGFYSYNFAFDYIVNPGDYVELIVSSDAIIGLDFMQCNNAGLGATTGSPVLVPVGIGDFFSMQQAIPQNIRQVDFLVSIVKLFNLYVYEDQFDDRLIHITPFIGFYNASTANAVDWSYKLNRSQVVRLKPMSELNSRIYNFNYKSDTDYWNDLYFKRYNQVYGSYIFDSLFEFATETNKLELIFAPTPLIGYLGEDKIYPTIFKLSGTVEQSVDSVVRIMQTKNLMGVSSWSIMDGLTNLGSYTNYGYAGHFDDPDNPDNDLNFGALNELFFPLAIGNLSKTQFNIYWSAYMAEITDKDSKLLTAKFYLTPLDIFNLDFSKYITIDGVLFRLNKITDYNASMPGDCEVELLKVINTSYSFPPGGIPETDRGLQEITGDDLEYSTGLSILYY